MRLNVRSTLAAAAVALSMLVGTASASTEANDEFKTKLGRFFDALAEVSGGATSGADAVQRLSPETIRELRETLSGMPGWENAPRRLAATIPADLRQQLDELAARAAADAADLDSFRRGLAEWGVATSLLPESALVQRGSDPTTLATQRRMIEGLDDAGLARLQQLRPELQKARTELYSQLPPEVADGVRRLAAHGTLDASERRELERFRSDLSGFLKATVALPPTVSTGLDAASAAALRSTLEDATPEMLYLLRDQLDTPAMRRTMAAVRKLAAQGQLDDAERASVDSFRAEFGALLRQAAASTATDADLDGWAGRLTALSPEETFLVRERISAMPGWRHLPQVWALSATPEIARQMDQAALGTLSTRERAALQSFRQQLSTWLGSLDTAEAVDAARTVQDAGLRTVVLMRALYAQVPSDEVPSAMSAAGVVEFAETDTPGLPSLADDCGAFQVVCDFFSGLLNGVSSAVNTVKNTVNTIASAVSNLGDTLTSLWQDLVMVFTPQSLGSALGIVGDWWTGLPTIPGLPCPEIGTDLGPFGVVGNREDAVNYNRNVWVIDQVIDIVPDTEISTAIKVGLKVVWGAVQYLGVCLDTAAETVAIQQTDEFRSDTLDRLDALAAGLTGLDGDVAGVAAGVGMVDQRVAGVQSSVDGVTSDVAAFRDSIEGQVGDFQDMALRLEIETDLAETGTSRVVMFALPESYGGKLELVREIVADTIDASSAAGMDTGAALNKLDQGDQAFAAGDYRGAYDRYRQAYRMAAGPCDTCTQ